jgi:hypothetical protein
MRKSGINLLPKKRGDGVATVPLPVWQPDVSPVRQFFGAKKDRQ